MRKNKLGEYENFLEKISLMNNEKEHNLRIIKDLETNLKRKQSKI